jgi:hypothetical protein
MVARRITSGALRYHDEDVPRGVPLLVADAKSGVADLVLPDGRVVALSAADVADNFDFSELPPNELAATAAKHRMARQPLEGEPIEPRADMLVQRTGLPFHAMHEHYAPRDRPLRLTDPPQPNLIFYVDTETFQERNIPVQYFTTAYFTVLAQHVPKAPELLDWMEALRLKITDRPIVREDLEDKLAEFGLNPADEIMEYWLRHLNDRTVSLTWLLHHLSRLINIFAEEPSVRAVRGSQLVSMHDDELRQLLAANPHKGWRTQLVVIGLVLQDRDQFSDAAVEAAKDGLAQYRP